MIDLRPVLQARIDRLRMRHAAVRKGLRADAVHDFRVACYEMRACRPLFRAVGPTGGWGKRICRAHTALSPLRDLQQMQQRLGDDPVLAAWLAGHAKPAARPWRRYRRKLTRHRFAAGLRRSARRLQQASPATLLAAWQQQWQRSQQKLQSRLLAAQSGELHHLHRLRTAYKQWRYLLELLAEAGAPLDVPALKDWQETLGEIADCSVMARLAVELHGPPGLAEAYARRAQSLASGFVAQALPVLADFIAVRQAAVAACLGERFEAEA